MHQRYIPQCAILQQKCACAHFCYKIVHCGICDWCIVGLCNRSPPPLLSPPHLIDYSKFTLGIHETALYSELDAIHVGVTWPTGIFAEWWLICGLFGGGTGISNFLFRPHYNNNTNLHLLNSLKVTTNKRGQDFRLNFLSFNCFPEMSSLASD